MNASSKFSEDEKHRKMKNDKNNEKRAEFRDVFAYMGGNGSKRPFSNFKRGVSIIRKFERCDADESNKGKPKVLSLL
jgi:hypothetical protein